MVVGAVTYDNHPQRPEDHLDDADEIGGRKRQAVGRIDKRLLHVRRAGAEVAIDSAEGLKGERALTG